MNALLSLPVLVPLMTAVACLLLWRRPEVQRVLSVVGMSALCASAGGLLAAVDSDGIAVTQVGSWPAPFGITLVADLLSAIMVLVSSFVGLSVAIYSLASIDREREAHGYHPLLNVLLMGVSGAFLTGDIFNLFVWFEVMLIASFVLIALGGEPAQLDGAAKYVTLNLISSTFFLSSVGILYGLAGTLNMADLATRLHQLERPGMVVTVAVMFLIAFGIKAAMFPLFFWLPASYHAAPVAVSAVLAGLLTKVGVYALMRIFTLLFTQDTAFTHTLLLVLSGLTMLSGVLGALIQSEFRRVLSFQIVSHIGFLTMGLGLFSRLALAASVFLLVHNIVIKTNLFLVSGVVERLGGSYQLKKLGGIYRDHPGLASLFLISALALAGLPPLSGFWGKLFLIKASLELRQGLIVGVILVVSLLTLLSMAKIWNEAFWKPASTEPPAKVTASSMHIGVMMAPIAALTAIVVLLGVFVAPAFDLALQAADQLLDPSGYVRAVTGAEP